MGGKSGGRGIRGEGMGVDLIKTQNMHGKNYQTIKYFLKFKNKRNITTSAIAGLRREEKKVTGSLTVFIPKDALHMGVIFNTSKLS